MVYLKLHIQLWSHSFFIPKRMKKNDKNYKNFYYLFFIYITDFLWFYIFLFYDDKKLKGYYKKNEICKEKTYEI